jgi:hypothetical protein
MDENKTVAKAVVKGGEIFGITSEKLDELLRSAAGRPLYWIPLLDDEGNPEGCVIFQRGRAEDLDRYRAQVSKGANYTDEARTLFRAVCVYPPPADQGAFTAFIDDYSGVPARVMNECLSLSKGERLNAAKKVVTISTTPSPTR